MNRKAIFGLLAGGLRRSRPGTLGRCHHRGARRRFRLGVHEGNLGQGLVHVPLDVVREHAEKDMGAYARFQTMVIGRIRRLIVFMVRKARSTTESDL